MEMKKELKSLFKGIVYVLVVYWTIVYFSTGLFTTWLILLGFNVLYLQYTNSLTFPTFLKNGLLLGGLLLFFKLMSKWGFGGYIIGILVIVGLILSTRFKKFLEVKQHMEGMIWGKPLKEFIKEGKRPPKIKITR
jgi:hypothetical protein